MEDRLVSQQYNNQQQQKQHQILFEKIHLLNLNFETFTTFPLSTINSSKTITFGNSNGIDGDFNNNNNNSSGNIIGNINRKIKSIMGNYNGTTSRGSSIIITSTTTTDINNDLNGYLKNHQNFNSHNIFINNQNFTSQNLGLLFNGNSSAFSDHLIDANLNSTDNNGLLQKLSEKFGRGLSSNEVNMIRNQITLSGVGNGGHYQSHEDLLQQMEYDKFMNEIWIGIVLTLIVISLVFCICSCFLYHQFRQWKRNYRQNIQRNYDIESVKLNIEDDDPVPNYTLVSGLPSYEAALELLRNSSSSTTALLLPKTPAPPYPSPPSVFNVFATNEKEENANSCQKLQSSSSSSSMIPPTSVVVPQVVATTTTTIPTSVTSTSPSATNKTEQQPKEVNSIPSYEEAIKNDSHVTTTQATQTTQTTIEKVVSNSSCDEILLDTKLSPNT